MAKQAKNGRLYLNQAELIKLNDFMRTILTTSSEGDKCIATYAVPWDDEAVVKHMKKEIPHLGLTHVQHFRLNLFGEVKRRTVSLGRPSPRLEAIEARLALLEDWAKDVEPKWPNYKS